MLPLSEIPKQVLTEASFNRFLNYHTPKGYIAMSACIGAKVMFGVDEPTAQQVEQVKRYNNQKTQQLKQELAQRGMTFFPVYGSYKEVVQDPATGQTYEELVNEASFLLFPRRKSTDTDERVAAQLMAIGKELATKYKQQSFLFKAPGLQQDAHYVTPTGNVDMSFNGIKLNDLSQEYATRFAGKTGKQHQFTYVNTPEQGQPAEEETYSLNEEPAPPPFLQEQYEPQQAVGTFWCHQHPGSMNEAMQRYGEVFWRE
jgi:hypothetical protein